MRESLFPFAFSSAPVVSRSFSFYTAKRVVNCVNIKRVTSPLHQRNPKRQIKYSLNIVSYVRVRIVNISSIKT